MQLPVTYLCFFILCGGFLQFMQHLLVYFKLDLSFGRVSRQTITSFSSILGKFFLCAISMSVMEVSLFIDTQFASYLPEGSVSLITYANRFMGIPLGVFAVAFSTILLPYFSRLSTYAPKRLNFYLLESAKLVFWVTIPCMLAMIFFSEKIFLTLFLSPTFTAAHAHEAGYILIAFVIGLFFFSFNKIILNVYYALHQTLLPSIVSIIATLVNIAFNFAFINSFHAVGLALATTLSGVLQTFLLLYFLKTKFGFHGYIQYFWRFIMRYIFQLAAICMIFLLVYKGILYLFSANVLLAISHFFLDSVGFWLGVADRV